jgi:cytochrome c oxidase subunit 3
LSPRSSIHDPNTSIGGGGRPPLDSWPGGGGGSGGRGGGDDVPYRERLRRYRLGVLLGLTSVVMVFVTFTTAYIVRKAGDVWDPTHNDYVSSWIPITLPLRVLLLNTSLLLLSGVTLELARRRAQADVALAPIARMPGIRVSTRASLPWIYVTILLGVAFLGGQYYAWRRITEINANLSSSVSSGFFFVLTGVHAVHLLGGILALLYAGATTWLRRPPETRRIVVDVTAWYWHFMALLWVYVFGLLYFVR